MYMILGDFVLNIFTVLSCVSTGVCLVGRLTWLVVSKAINC